jgi:hypothetical protein
LSTFPVSGNEDNQIGMLADQQRFIIIDI